MEGTVGGIGVRLGAHCALIAPLDECLDGAVMIDIGP